MEETMANGTSMETIDSVMKQIYTTCDIENSNSVQVSTLINYVAPFIVCSSVDGLDMLQAALDPSNMNPYITSEEFYSVLRSWADQIMCGKDEDQNSSPCGYGHETCDRPVYHSTPKSSYGQNLIRNYETFSLENISYPSTNDSRAIKSLECKQTTAPSERSYFVDRIKELEHKLQITTNELHTCRLQLATSEEQNAEFQIALTKMNKRLNLEQQNNELLQKKNQEISGSEEAVYSARLDINNLQKELSSSKKQIAILEGHIEKLEIEYEVLEIKYDEIRKREQETRILISNMVRDREFSEVEICKHKKIEADLNDKLKEQNNLIDHYTNLNMDSKEQIDILKRALENMSKNNEEKFAEGYRFPRVTDYSTDFIGAERSEEENAVKEIKSPVNFTNLHEEMLQVVEDNQNKRFKECEQQLFNTQIDLNKIQSEKDQLLFKLESIENSNETLQNVIREKSEKLVEVESRLSKYVVLEEDMLSFKCLIEDKNKELKDLQNKLNHVTNKKNILKGKIETDIAREMQRINSLYATNDQLQGYVDVLKGELELTKSELCEVIIKIERNIQSKDTMTEDKDNLNRKIKELFNEKNKLQEVMSVNMNNAQKKHDEDTLDKLDLERRLRESNTDILKIKEVNQLLESQLQIYKNEIDRLNAERLDVEQQLQLKGKSYSQMLDQNLYIEESVKCVMEKLSQLSTSVSPTPSETNVYGRIENLKFFVDLLVKQTLHELSKLQKMEVKHGELQARIRELEEEKQLWLLERTEMRSVLSSSKRGNSFDRQLLKIDKLHEQNEVLRNQLKQQKVQISNNSLPQEALSNVLLEKERIEKEKQEALHNLEQVQNEIIIIMQVNKQVKDDCKQQIESLHSSFQKEVEQLHKDFRVENENLTSLNRELKQNISNLERKWVRDSCDENNEHEELHRNLHSNQKNVKKFTLPRIPLVPSEPCSPDSPSLELGGSSASIYGIADCAEPVQRKSEAKHYFKADSCLLKKNITVQEFQDEEVLPNHRDIFLENLGLNSDSTRPLSKKELEEKFTVLAVSWKIDSSSTKQKYQKHKERCGELRDMYLKHLLQIVNYIKNHKCQREQHTLIKVLRQVNILKNLVVHLCRSAELQGFLKHEVQTLRCWNLVLNYVATLRQESTPDMLLTTRRTSDYSLKSSDLGSIDDESSMRDIPEIEYLPAALNQLTTDRSTTWKSLYKKSRRFGLMVVLTLCFIILIAMAHVHIKCVYMGKGRKMCPLDYLLDGFIKLSYVGIPPH